MSLTSFFCFFAQKPGLPRQHTLVRGSNRPLDVAEDIFPTLKGRVVLHVHDEPLVTADHAGDNSCVGSTGDEPVACYLLLRLCTALRENLRQVDISFLLSHYCGVELDGGMQREQVEDEEDGDGDGDPEATGR